MYIENISIKRNSCVGQSYNIDYHDLILLNILRGSSIENAIVSSDIIPNIHIGQFCTIKSNVTFRLPSHNFFHRITTSDDQYVCALAGNVIGDPYVIKGQIIIQNDVWIGNNATIKGGVKIGNGAVVMENSYVVEDVPPYAIVEGNPAKIVDYRFTEEQISALQDIAWWDWGTDDIIDRKPDFALPIQKFIEKYRVPATQKNNRSNASPKRFLLFPDFGYPGHLWVRIMEEYCQKCIEGNVLGQLFIYVDDGPHADDDIKEVQDIFSKFNDERADIIVQVGAKDREEELFKHADYLITTKEIFTVYHTCLADRYDVKILSGIDMPDVFGTLCDSCDK